MKILIISWYFPPANTIAAVRIGRLAEYLHEKRYDVRIVCAKHIPADQNLTSSFPEAQIVRTKWLDGTKYLTSPSNLIRMFHKKKGGHDKKGKPDNIYPKKHDFLSSAKTTINDIVAFPDKHNGWIPYGVRSTLDLIRDWRPDLVFASGPPFSTLAIGHIVTKMRNLPLVCEFRDRWWDDPYGHKSSLGRFLEKHCEARIVRDAMAISTVSEPWAGTYRERYHKPVVVIANGYDEVDMSNASFVCPFANRHLNIVYTGGIYPIHRDPSPLFAAIAQNPDLRHAVIVWFYGTKSQHLEPLIEQYDIAQNVKIMPAVPHDEAMYLQHRADALLLMQWNDPREQGNVPGKFFEYLGTSRPILLLGLKGGVPDTILRERQAGLLCSSVEAIAVQLSVWLATKTAAGSVPAVDPNARSGFSRREQYEKLGMFFEDLCDEVRSTPIAGPTTIPEDTE